MNDLLKNRVNNQLNEVLANLPNSPLKTAMQYSTQNGGKRVRAILTYLTAEMFGADLSAADAPAIAIELMHAFSLIHDDLPAMDDDDLRRGKPTCHKVYGEAIAILAGDALQTLSFEILAKPSVLLTKTQQIQMITTLAEASGAAGMGLGQLIDIENLQTLSLAELNHLHLLKTGQLIAAAIKMGALAAIPNDQKTINKLFDCGLLIGLAFQIQDDCLDKIGSTEITGKSTQTDQKLNKTTYVSLMGVEPALKEATRLLEQSIEILNGLPTHNQKMGIFIRNLMARHY